MAKFCKNCGSPLEEGEKFCAECGNTVETAPAQEAVMSAEEAAIPEEAVIPEEAAAPQEAAPPPYEPPQEQFAPPPPPVPPQEQFAPPPPPVPPQEQYAAPPQGQYAPPPPPMPPQGQYAPAGQPGYPPPGAPAPKKGLSKKLLILIIVAAAVAALIVVAIVVGKGALGKYEKMDFFEIGPDKVPSVMNVLGEERSISGFSSTVIGTSQTLIVTYKVAENQGNDMIKYTQALMNQYGFTNTTPYDFTGSSGGGFEFATNSVEDGYIISLTVSFDESGYVLLFMRMAGTLTVYEEEPEEEEPVVEEEEEEEEEEPANTGPSADEMDLIVPLILAGGSTVEEVQSQVDDRITVVEQNPDGSFTFRILKADQQDLIDAAKEETEQLIREIYEDDFYAGIEDIEWNTEDFSEINFIVTDEFFADDSYSIFAVLLTGFAAPMVQVYMGMGLDSITYIYISDAATGDLINTIAAPDDLLGIFE